MSLFQIIISEKKIKQGYVIESAQDSRGQGRTK